MLPRYKYLYAIALTSLLLVINSCHDFKKSYSLSDGGIITHKVDTTAVNSEYADTKVINLTSIKLNNQGSNFKITNKKYLTSDGGVFYRTQIDTVKYTPKTKDTSLLNGKFNVAKKKIVYSPPKVDTIGGGMIKRDSTSVLIPSRNAKSIAEIATDDNGLYILPDYIPYADWRTPTQSFEFNYYGECKISTHHPGSCTQGITTTVIGIYEIKNKKVYIYEILPKWELVDISPTVFLLNETMDTLYHKETNKPYVSYSDDEIPPFEFK